MAIDWFPSPAKINLFLHINHRLKSGYHHLQTYFQLLSFGDDIGIELTRDGILSMANSIAGVADKDNLIIKAANELKPLVDKSYGVKFHIRKRLPMGGGIGGGSSNAATVLVALNECWHIGLSHVQLMEIATKLGADVPVFVNGKSGFATGIGENIQAAALPEKWFLVATPKVHISTAEIFNSPDLTRDTPLIDLNSYSFETTRNDCETLVVKHYPEVANLLQWLVNYAPSRMTGTGASVFAIFDGKKEAESVLERLPSTCDGFVCRGVAESELHQQLQEVRMSFN